MAGCPTCKFAVSDSFTLAFTCSEARSTSCMNGVLLLLLLEDAEPLVEEPGRPPTAPLIAVITPSCGAVNVAFDRLIWSNCNVSWSVCKAFCALLTAVPDEA